jgi:predicted dinucleotide-binding enzyme
MPPASGVAAELAQLLPHSKIVRALSTTVEDQPGEPTVTGLSVDVLVGGDDDEAVSTVMQLAKDVGYHPLAAGKPDGSCEQRVPTPRSLDLTQP